MTITFLEYSNSDDSAGNRTNQEVQLLPHGHTDDDKLDMKARNMLFNIDGLGVVWYTSSQANFECSSTSEYCIHAPREGLRPAMYKTVQPPKNDMNFRSICANTETRVCFAHIRAASDTAITIVNNHPFVFGRHSFMHNGLISDFVSLRRAINSKMSDAVFANVFGTTDSEHLAGLYMTYLTNSGEASSFEKEYSADEMASAMYKAVSTVIELQRSIIGDSKRTPNSLNVCATDGVRLIAYRFRNHKTSQPPTLYYSTKAGTTLNRKYLDHPDGVEIAGMTNVGKADIEHGQHLIIASEPSTYKEADWELIGKNQFLLADSDGTFKTEDVPYDTAWDARGHTL